MLLAHVNFVSREGVALRESENEEAKLLNQKQAAIQKLTFESVQVRAVLVPFRRKIIAKVGEFTHWPFILIDVRTKEGVTGSAYLEPYLQKSVQPLARMIEDIGAEMKGKVLAPLDAYRDAMQTLHLNGRQGMSVIAVSGLDMAIWDALAKAAGMPLAALLGGTPGKVRAYNTNGLWLIPLDKLAREAEELVAEGGFKAIKMRLGRATLKEDIAAIAQVRGAVGENVQLMCDFNQGLAFGDALLRVSETADWLEWSDWAEPILAEPLTAKDGFVTVGDRPGSGLAWNEEAVKRFAL